MIVIADSGSTKTEWVIIDSEKKSFFKTAGLNPFFITSSLVTQELIQNFPKEIPPKKIKKVFFFGAGCSSTGRCKIIKIGLKDFFPYANLHIDHDIMGAAISLFGNSSGIAMILGTGSNSCIYDGVRITHNIPALGYILGDEGSGAFFGLQLLKDYLNKEMPPDVYNKFTKTFQPSREEILDRVYKQAFPNRYLASFAPFLSENLTSTYIWKLVEKGFDLFFKRHITPYPDYHTYQLGSVGSVGYFLQEPLKKIALKYGFETINILRSPLEGLIKHIT